jgi:hypothetical protein
MAWKKTSRCHQHQHLGQEMIRLLRMPEVCPIRLCLYGARSQEIQMKKGRSFLGIAVFVIILLPCYAAAQGQEPPPCCRSGNDEPTAPETKPDRPTDTQITVSESVLVAMGLSRSEFVDRLAAGLFPNSEVSLVLSTSSNVDPATAFARRAPGRLSEDVAPEESLVAVQVKRYYQVARSRVRPSELENLDQLYITDGQVYVAVSFTRSSALLASR